MNKIQRSVLITAFLIALLLSGVAGVYAVTKLPEQAFVEKFSLPQMDFKAYATFGEAVRALHEIGNTFISSEILFTSEHGEATITLERLGAKPLAEELEDEMLHFMEESTGLEKLEVYLLGRRLSFPLRLDLQKLSTAFNDSGIEQGKKNAEFTYENGLVSVLPEQIGYGVDEETLAKMIQNYWKTNFAAPSTAKLPLNTSTAPIRTSDLEALVPQAQVQAARTFTLEDEYSDAWELPLAENIRWLEPGTEKTFQINEAAFVTYVELTLVPEVEKSPLPVIITENEEGAYEFHGSARFGREIDKTALRISLEEAIATGTDGPIRLPILQVDPMITVPDSLREKGVTDLLGYGYSTYKSSPQNRIANVNRGFEQFNGVLVGQGTEFSFTTLMGPIDAAHGWLPELVIKGDETIPEYGGGLCQVSSTMFRAALYTGMPLTARKNHSYAVSYYAYPYGYGLDATIYNPVPDLRFMNDTPGAILIQGYTEGFDAYFVFYGTHDGRTVNMDGPYAYDYTSVAEAQVTYTDELEPGVRELDEYAHTGFKVDWYRTVTYLEGSLSTYAAASGVRENIHSEYAARPAKYLEGKAEDQSTGAATVE